LFQTKCSTYYAVCGLGRSTCFWAGTGEKFYWDYSFN